MSKRRSYSSNSHAGLSRRAFVGAAAGAMAVAQIPSLAWAQGKPASLTYGTYGGDYGQWMKTVFMDPYTAETGVKLVVDVGSNPERLAKLKTYRDQPRLHIVQFLDRFLYEGTRDGLFEDLDYSKIPNAAAYPAAFKKKTWVALDVIYIGIVYNAEKVKQPPRNWGDILDDRYKGRIFIDDFNHFGLHAVVAMAMANGGGYDNIMPGMKMIKEMKDRLNPRFITTSPEGMKLLRDNEVDIALWQNSRSYILKREGKPIEYAVPATGDVAVPYGHAIVKNSGGPAEKEFAHKYLDYTASAALQGKYLSGAFPGNWTNPEAEKHVTPEVLKLIARPAGAKQLELDYNEVLPRLADWTTLWNKTIAG